MNKSLFLHLFLLMGVVWGSGTSIGAEAASAPVVYRAGAAKVDITPKSFGPMWGYGARGKTRATGTIAPLQARALVIHDGTAAIALVSLDLGRAPVDPIVKRVREKAKTYGIKSLFLVGSHTHHGPAMESEQGGAWPEWKAWHEQLEESLNQVISEAGKNLAGCTIRVASEETPLNRNRHDKGANPPRDGRLTVLVVDSEAGKPLARAVHFSAHSVLTPGTDLRFGPDWPGEMARILEDREKAPVLFLQGAAGDLSPNMGGAISQQGAAAFDPKEPTWKNFGLAMANKVSEMIPLAKKLKPGTVQGHRERIHLPVRMDTRNPFFRLTLGRAFYPELVVHYEREYREGITTPLEVALLGSGLAFVGIAGEPFCSHALELQRRFPSALVLTLGYCNEYHQYFPTIEAIAKGGYGTEPYIASSGAGSGEFLFNRALYNLYRLTGAILPGIPTESGPFKVLID